MSHNMSWDINKYREEHESEDQWQLRKAFLLKWKDHYPEERLVCLARVFTNIEFMGCRYPTEVMHEIARLSADVAKDYRNDKKTKLQRTFVSASDAAADRARAVKRKGGIIVESSQKKITRIAFLPQSQNKSIEANDEDIGKSVDRLLQKINGTQNQIKMESENDIASELNNSIIKANTNEKSKDDVKEICGSPQIKNINYMEEMSKIMCLDPKEFNESMFNTEFGQFVLVIRPWIDMINNFLSSCAILKIPAIQKYHNGVFTVIVNDEILVSMEGHKVTARAKACRLVWDKLRARCVILVLKEQWTSQNDARISVDDLACKKSSFGEPIEDSVALKMMKLMGWKGGGLGADSQGIVEPIKPNLRMVNRAGLGHEASRGLAELKRAGMALMRRRGVALDEDLVFASDFTAEERAILHRCANICGLFSKSYGTGRDRFLVVTNKLQPLQLVRAVVKCGGDTPKYRVFIPATILEAGIDIFQHNPR